jgi:hypothetical protein
MSHLSMEGECTAESEDDPGVARLSRLDGLALYPYSYKQQPDGARVLVITTPQASLPQPMFLAHFLCRDVHSAAGGERN